MKLLTIILNYKTAEMTLESASAALKALDYLQDEWKLIIVDNDSQDNSYEIISAAIAEKQQNGLTADWKKVDILQSGRNGGFGAGNNFAIREALKSDDPPDYIYILNSDAFPNPSAIQFLSQYLDSHSNTGFVGSYIHGTDNEPHTTAFRFPTLWSEFETSIRLGLVTKLFKNYVVPLGIPEKTQEVNWLAGASMMMRTDVLQQIGLFDETFFLYFEETDLCQRAKNANWKTIYVKESKVAHIGSVSTGMKKWDRIPQYWLDSRKHYFKKNYGQLYYLGATTLRLLGGMLWKIRCRIQNKFDPEPKRFLRDLVRHTLK